MRSSGAHGLGSERGEGPEDEKAEPKEQERHCAPGGHTSPNQSEAAPNGRKERKRRKLERCRWHTHRYVAKIKLHRDRTQIC